MTRLSNKKFKFQTPDESPGFLLWQVSAIWHRKINQTLRPYNLTHTQFVIMTNIFWLTEQNKTVTQIQISQLSKIDPVVVSNVLKTLEQKQFVERKETGDLRAKNVLLTQKGNDILTPSLKAVELFDEQFFNGINNLSEAKNIMRSLIREN
ncbi:MarR family transcriptional regulator [bacterium]|jgi:MarR family transcriptional regulator, organic hydroperoxide resistance regulator|nr:MarR family transcriptional regulator [bacterium]